jgi:hypothetical protein
LVLDDGTWPPFSKRSWIRKGRCSLCSAVRTILCQR